ncbi:Extracellular ligand-binding receptor [Hyphomicrobium sp. GJ21]|uniref:ABC transporter substrate-binding protein n=1 Tax=Hyphomicrobium sp. GJ21 TaxID=113574 RepID=UPI000622C1F4|nr:ABC transporter substrate-binding protein [Hyphomicrobium sp. GJ21]CEJ83620.1 Extracellular ligand-binding receptor [Hyphomicrobium sp. GJ21]
MDRELFKDRMRGTASILLRRATAILIAIFTVIVSASMPVSVDSVDDVEAAQRPPLSVPIFISSRDDLCYDNGQVAAIRRLAVQEQRRINRHGGVAGRRLQLTFLDDQRDEKKAAANMGLALSDPQTLAMIGMSNATRAKAAFDASGKDIKKTGIPFVSDISVAALIADYPNVFTTRPSEDEERMPVIAEFVKQMKIARPAFIGLDGQLASSNFGDALTKLFGPGVMAADHRLHMVGDDLLDPGELASAIADLKSKNIDFVFLSVGGSRTADVLKKFKTEGLTPPAFVTGRITSLGLDGDAAYPNDIFQLAWDGFPDVYNDRLRKLVSESPDPDAWIFQGAKNNAAPGWKSGKCKARDEDVPLSVVDDDNMRALSVGTQYADMVGLIAEAARGKDATTSLPDLRSLIVQRLQSAYVQGRGTFQGRFDNWSFQQASRAAARTPMILMLPRGLGHAQLAPLQFVHLRNNSMQRIDTLYADIDLIRAEHIDDNEKTFLADFYLSMNDRGGASIEQIEFSNAYLEPGSNDRQITVRQIHDGGKSEAFPDHMKIYRVSGKFLFEPQLLDYPFDTQRFSIDIQPKSNNAPFIVQPPPDTLRDRLVNVDGWLPKDQYVGYDEDFVRTVDAQTLQPSVVPFYKANFVWLMKRQTTDYFLRVVVPLGFILMIAYLSIFISTHHFEAIVTIQVTALLSAVALYLALPKLDANVETLSDRMFLFSYLMLSIIIAITIARVNKWIEPVGWLRKSLSVLHIAGVPLATAALAFYVYELSLL